jgi:hypothetical protein
LARQIVCLFKDSESGGWTLEEGQESGRRLAAPAVQELGRRLGCRRASSRSLADLRRTDGHDLSLQDGFKGAEEARESVGFPNSAPIY